MPGGLFRSDDGGISWGLTEALWHMPERRQWMGVAGGGQPGIHSVLVDPKNPADIRVGVSIAGIWASTDDGASWRIINHGMYNEYMPPEQREDPIVQDVHRLARCAAYPEVVWCQHHNGVFRSEDGGANWREVTAIRPSKFGFAVVAHPRDPDTAWFIPAVKDERRIPVDGKIVVARTRDGGNSFEVLRNGLPQHHAYDLVWRHALAVDASGERLAFGSTSGGLWISEDCGDSWTAPDARLPPVFGRAVRGSLSEREHSDRSGGCSRRRIFGPAFTRKLREQKTACGRRPQRGSRHQPAAMAGDDRSGTPATRESR
jgi:hypothetical protein